VEGPQTVSHGLFRADDGLCRNVGAVHRHRGQYLKFAIGRARPLIYDQEGIFSFAPFNMDFLHQSFPSGHSANIGALFVALALLFPRFRLAFIGIGLWLGATRIIVGVHYPSDVTAGLALGAWLAFATSILFARFGLVFSIGRDGGWPTPRLSRLL
jgi:membrane-associated phospholipid phosphatase